MTRSISSEKVTPSSFILPKTQFNQLNARWIVVDGKLICKWAVE